MSEPVQRAGFPFTFNPDRCETCQGHCCTGESGYIWASLLELERMAEHVSMSLDAFTGRYTHRVEGRYTLVEKPWADGEHACVFFDDGCTIYPARPRQCRTFPFWSRYRSMNLEELLEECPGVKVLSPRA